MTAKKKKAPTAHSGVAQHAEESVARRVAWRSLQAVVVCLPLVMTNVSWTGSTMAALTNDQFELPKLVALLVLAAVMLGGWSWDMLTRGGTLRTTPVFWAGGAFLLAAGVSTAFSIHLPTSIIGQYARFEGWQPSSHTASSSLWACSLSTPSTGFARSRGCLSSLRQLLPPTASSSTSGSIRSSGATRRGRPSERSLPSAIPIHSAASSHWCCRFRLALAISERGAPRRTSRLVGVLAPHRHRAARDLHARRVDRRVRGAGHRGVRDRVGQGAAAGARMRYPLASAVIGAAVLVVRSLGSESEVTNVAARLRSIFELGSGSGRTRTLIWQAAIKAGRRATRSRLRPRHVSAQLRAPALARVRGPRAVRHHRRQRAQLPAAARGHSGDCRERCSSTRRHCGHSSRVRAGVQTRRRHRPACPRGAVGGLGGLPRAPARGGHRGGLDRTAVRDARRARLGHRAPGRGQVAGVGAGGVVGGRGTRGPRCLSSRAPCRSRTTPMRAGSPPAAPTRPCRSTAALLRSLRGARRIAASGHCPARPCASRPCRSSSR